MKHRGKWKFKELLLHLIDNEIITYGEIIVYGTDKDGHYEKIHHCGLGTFTGIGYHHLLAEANVDSFDICFNKDGNICKFYLS